MSGKKKYELKDEGGEDWLVSYADMMTLIACFFILMMAFAHFDPVGFSAKAEKFSKAFRKDKNKSSSIKLQEITEEVAKHDLKDRAKISLKQGELIVTFSTSTLFKNGKHVLTSDADKMLDSLVDVIKITNPSYRILIEGHADDSLKNTNFQTQWELSVARAAYIAKKFENYGFPKDRIVPIGRGNSRLIVDSLDKEGKRVEKKARLNRRVVVRLLEPVKKEAVKFGLGIYFRDSKDDVKEDPLNEVDAIKDNYEVKSK